METVTIQDTETVIIDGVQESIVIEAPEQTLVITGIMGPPGFTELSAADDLDLTSLTDGAVLVYKSDTSKWKATTTLDSQILEAGQF